MREEEIAVKLTEHEQKICGLQRRMDKIEIQTENINKLTVSVQKLADSVSEIARNQDRAFSEHEQMGSRLHDLEIQPAKTARKLHLEIIKAIVAAIAGGLVTYLLTFL